jgi:hypothetical protein
LKPGRSYRAIIVLLIAFLAPALGLSQTSSPALTPDVIEKRASLYKYGVELFTAGQFEESLQIFENIAGEFPNYIPAQIGLARCQYHLERMVPAFQIFNKIPLRTLSDDVAYEYAYSHFANRDYENALKGFRKVTRGNKLFGLANYFGAIAAVKTNRYQLANRMIDNAVNLPRKYAISRELYEKHIDEILSDRQATELKNKEQKVKGAKPAETKPADAPYEHGGFQSVDKSATFSTDHKVQYKGYEYVKTEENNFRTNSFTFTTGYMHVFSPEQKRSPVLGIGGTLAAQQKDSVGVEVRFDDEPKDRNVTFSKKADVNGTLFYEQPFAKEMWGSVIFTIDQTYPDLGAEFSSNDKRAELVIGQSGDITVSASGSYNLSSDKESDIYSYLEESGSIGKTIIGFPTTLTIRAQQYTYIREVESGEQNAYKGELKVAFPDFWDIKSSVKGAVQLQKDYYNYDVEAGADAGEDETGIAIYDIMSYSGTFEFSRKFFGWLKLSGETVGEKRNIQNVQIVEAAGNEFPEVSVRSTEYNFVSSIAGKISIDLLF